MNNQNKNLQTRKSIRLKDYDYSADGMYFVTICTQNRECIFGNVMNREMKNNVLGNLVVSTWKSLPEHYHIELDEFQIMPNHFHGIIVIVGAGLDSVRGNDGHSQYGRPQGSPLQKLPTLGNIIGAFKSLSTNEWKHGKFWQRNYYEHVIRNDAELNGIREYIKTNPQMWDRDRNNPEFKNLIIKN